MLLAGMWVWSCFSSDRQHSDHCSEREGANEKSSSVVLIHDVQRGAVVLLKFFIAIVNDIHVIFY